MTWDAARNRERIAAAIPAAMVQVLLGMLLFTGFDVDVPTSARDVMKLIRVLPEVPPPPEERAVPPPEPVRENARPNRVADPRPEGAASPPNLKSRPTEIVAPEPVVRLPVPPPVVAARVPGPGMDPMRGAADIRGPGAGSGGFGTGTGSGRFGGGDGGGGGGGGGMTPPRRIRGSLRDSDYPAEIGEAGIGGRVEVIFAVGTDGRVSNCRITESSGNRYLDVHTCRLIEQRFVYRPSLDRLGRPIRSQIIESYTWVVEDFELPYEERVVRRRRFPF